MSETVEQITKQELDALRNGSLMLYSALNSVHKAHELGEMETEDGKVIEVCLLCSEMVGEGKGVYYPCPTMEILLEYFVVAPESSDEETPAE